MKFTMELVRNYLEGNDLEDYTIEELDYETSKESRAKSR